MKSHVTWMTCLPVSYKAGTRRTTARPDDSSQQSQSHPQQKKSASYARPTYRFRGSSGRTRCDQTPRNFERLCRPTSKKLKRVMGMVTYLVRFVPNIANVLQPRSSMMSSREDFVWENTPGGWKKNAQEEAFRS